MGTDLTLSGYTSLDRAGEVMAAAIERLCRRGEIDKPTLGGYFKDDEPVDLEAIHSVPEYLSEIARSDRYLAIPLYYPPPASQRDWLRPRVYVTGQAFPDSRWTALDVTVDETPLRKYIDEGPEDAAAWLPAGSRAWISMRAVANDDYRFIQALDFFATVAGIFEGPEEPRFDYLAWDGLCGITGDGHSRFDPADSLYDIPYTKCAVYYRSLRDLAQDYARMYVCCVRNISLTELLPRYGRDNPEEELRKLETQLQQNAGRSAGKIGAPASMAYPIVAGHLTLPKVKELLTLTEDELRRRLYELPEYAPECSWIDGGPQGVILAVPLNETLANAYRALAECF